MQSDTFTKSSAPAALFPFDRYLDAQNEVLRCAAFRALVACRDDTPDAVRAALLTALLDEDPDIRTDAMELLAPMAQPKDAEALRRSLQGDPVREVKLAAINGLALLQDTASVPLLRSLAVSRSEDQVTWEDDGADWEDWLDIQTSAIRALGELKAEDAIDDLVVALFDEFGQSVDVTVYQALVQIGEVGIAALIEIFNQSSGVARRRAAAAMTQAGAADLEMHKEALLAADDTQLRILALRALASDDPRCVDLALHDPDAEVRIAALRSASTKAPELAVECLADNDETVKAAAIECLRAPLNPDLEEALIYNMLMWLERAKPTLAITVIEQLPKHAPHLALRPILDVLDDPDRELEIRVAAAKALGVAELETPLSMIAKRLDNPARQVRTTLITVLRTLAKRDQAAVILAAQAIEGDLLLAEQPAQDVSPDMDTPDAGTPKEGSGPRKIWITPDGDIVERNEDEDPTGNSTLDAILADPAVTLPPEMAGDTPEESGAKRAKRRAVEGTEDIALSLCCDAMTIFGDFDSDEITQAIISRVEDPDERVKRTAWGALVGRDVSSDFLQTARQGFENTDAIIRLSAFQITSPTADTDTFAKALVDDDPLIRREAVLRLPVNAALDFIGDRNPTVREAAVTCIIQSGEAQLQHAATQQAILTERTDTIAQLVSSAPAAMAHVTARLKETDLSNRQALIILSAIATGGTTGSV